ncbi:MAG: gephyrin-like molybdotransferase Glp [Aliishimia sp.]
MSRFDTVVMVDWSGGNDAGPTPKRDAIWACIGRNGETEDPVYLRSRQSAEIWLAQVFEAELAAGRRVLAGFDFPFGYPTGFAQTVCGTDDPLDLWHWLEARIEDHPKSNNRFDIAAQINRAAGQGKGPFWANALQRDIDGLARNKAEYANPFPDKRACEQQATGAFTCWQLAGAGAVGSQVLMGLPVLERLRRRFDRHVAVWPFQPLNAPIALVEIWPSLTLGREPEGVIRDAWQVQQVAQVVSTLPDAQLAQILDVDAPEEGWIFGLGYEDQLKPVLVPPPLRNDCFALPAGVDWIPVDDALAYLRSNLKPVVGKTICSLDAARGAVLAKDVKAFRANPPHPNTAVDGYGFAGGRPVGVHVLPLVADRAAAGDTPAPVGEGCAIRILTGAALPDGVDTVVLQEDVTLGDGQIAFHGPIKPGANTRRAGEDVTEDALILEAGRKLTPADLAIAAATGHGSLPVCDKLRVGVVSTGDELLPAGAVAKPGMVFDANRPMLLSLLTSFGFEAVDLGHVEDTRDALRARLNDGANQCDAILTSGGASAGDEDHVSALLGETGALQMWRIAVKPGRPLALGVWEGTPIFGLPGNPVAALVCTLIFARPALGLLAGQDWKQPQGFDVPAAFSKSKKPGRREYLRARMRDGRVEAFASEGSGRISGLSWADGLVELPDEGASVTEGDLVRYIPFASFL